MRYIITLALAATPSFAEVPKVVTDIPPVHSLVAEVMGELGQPELLLAKGADEHDFQLRPSQMAVLGKADIVVWVGPELTPWLGDALAATGDSRTALTLLEHRAVTRTYGVEGEHDHAAEDHGDDHDGLDPHLWLDPDNAELWVGLIADQLSRHDAENAAVYAANAATAVERLRALDAEVGLILAPVRGKPIVTFHDAFGYYFAHYGLASAGSIALGDASSPGAARLVDLRAEIEAGGVLCVFPEVQHDPALVEQMAEGTGARIGGPLDPVGSSLEAGPGAYAALMRGLAQTIADCAAR